MSKLPRRTYTVLELRVPALELWRYIIVGVLVALAVLFALRPVLGAFLRGWMAL